VRGDCLRDEFGLTRAEAAIPAFESFEALNGHLLDCCRKRLGDRLRGHDEMIGARPATPSRGQCRLIDRNGKLGVVKLGA
jgi:hypothetical protein